MPDTAEHYVPDKRACHRSVLSSFIVLPCGDVQEDDALAAEEDSRPAAADALVSSDHTGSMTGAAGAHACNCSPPHMQQLQQDYMCLWLLLQGRTERTLDMLPDLQKYRTLFEQSLGDDWLYFHTHTSRRLKPGPAAICRSLLVYRRVTDVLPILLGQLLEDAAATCRLC